MKVEPGYFFITFFKARSFQELMMVIWDKMEFLFAFFSYRQSVLLHVLALIDPLQRFEALFSQWPWLAWLGHESTETAGIWHQSMANKKKTRPKGLLQSPSLIRMGEKCCVLHVLPKLSMLYCWLRRFFFEKARKSKVKWTNKILM